MSAKKWCYAGVWVLLSVSVAVGAPPAVHPVTGEPLVIECLWGTPEAIDGDLSDWNLAAMTPAVLDASAQIYTGQSSWTGPADCSGQFYLLWDDTYIYVALVAKDDRLSMSKTNGDIWNADCAEIFFGTTEWGTSASDHTQHYQYGFNANNQTWNWCNMDSAGQSAIDYMQCASSRTADGYICEVAIEHARIAALDFTVGNTISFHPCIDDTEATDRELQITWTGREAHDQSQGFGHLILSDKRAIAKELSRDPIPANGAVDVPIDTMLSWTQGAFAVSHDVYFGMVFDDVNDASRADPRGVLASQAQTTTSYDPPGRLAYGQTYYWRVDEVNGAPDFTIHKGMIWSFTTEPVGYPIANIIATSNGTSDEISTPQRTVDGSGINDKGEASIKAADMWLADPPADGSTLYIQYEFDGVYKLHEMLVWNYNVQFEPILGFGLKNVTVEYSENGTDWMTLGDVEVARGTATSTYKANTTVDFGGVPARYVRLNVNSGWGMLGQFGLSEVRFLYIPAQAREPRPADGAVEVDPDTILSWRAGRNAVSHEVYLGTDPQSLTLVGTADEAAFAPGNLVFGNTYYWQIVEVNEADAVPAWAGSVWSFSTREYAWIDGFETYNDDLDAKTTIFDTWLDGWINNTGSTVGYFNAPFAEKTIIHSGKQSMPLAYDNTKSPFYSEAEREFQTVQNWTGNGADTLVLYVRGNAPDFVETAGGQIIMSAVGTDIWNNTDQFRYAYKSLSGNGSITVRVDSLVRSNEWAKAGVMIRETLEPGSKHAFVALTPEPSHGLSFQRRPVAGQASANTDVANIPLPHWVKLTRTGNVFTAQQSADGVTWTDIVVSPALTIEMAANVYIGLAVCSHDGAIVTAAEFSNLSTTGNVTGAWQTAEIGVAQPKGNAADTMYVRIEDSAGKSATVVNADGAVTVRATWQEWMIPYSALSGVNLGRVEKMVIGVGSKTSPKAGGTGTVYIDDIGYGRSVAP
ncbi:MAG TPA: sugar-binding protein [Sedimentisphaerales bacterium]|mgnify:FL=1|nr:sugar-binding protein [Sedimentisphaerales bacterium]